MRPHGTTTDMMRGYVADAILHLLKKLAYAQVAIKEVAAEALTIMPPGFVPAAVAKARPTLRKALHGSSRPAWFTRCAA